MPRGVYERKAGTAKAVSSSVPTGQAQAAQVAAASAAATPPAAAAAPDARAPQRYTRDDFRRSVDDMHGDLLKAYARSIGILQRDVDNLTEDRLRQNCKARAFAALED